LFLYRLKNSDCQLELALGK